MSPEIIGLIGLGLFFLVLALGVPIGGAMGLIGFVGYLVISGLEPSLKMAAIMPYANVSVYSLSVIPLFITMGHFAYYAGFPTNLFDAAQRWIGRLSGGIVQATIVAAAAFGAASGSMLASCAVISKITIPEMLKQGIDRRLAFGAVAASGTIAGMIPPSIAMVIYGVITETSIGKLLIAGIIPGIVAAINYMILVYIMVKLNPGLAPLTPRRFSWKERFSSVPRVWGFALMVGIVLGGLYTGMFTPTEAGAVGACGMLLMALAMRRLSRGDLRACLLEATKTTGSIFFILIGAFMFGYFLSICRIPFMVCDFLVTLDAPPMVVLIGILMFYILLGFVMDELAALFLTLPIIFPAVVQLGFDPIWFGVLMAHVQEVGLITPPYGINIFVIKSVIPESKTGEIIRGISWFLLVDMVTLAMYIAFPQLSLFLPSLMK